MSTTTSVATPLAVEPQSPTYDPVKLLSFGNVSLGSSFDREPRDTRFALPREKMLKETVAADLTSLHAKASLIEVECRTAVCKVTFVGDSLEEAVWGSLTMQGTAAGQAIQDDAPYRKDGKVYLPVLVGYDAESRDSDAWEKTHAKGRAASLARMQGKPVREGWPPLSDLKR